MQFIYCSYDDSSGDSSDDDKMQEESEEESEIAVQNPTIKFLKNTSVLANSVGNPAYHHTIDLTKKSNLTTASTNNFLKPLLVSLFNLFSSDQIYDQIYNSSGEFNDDSPLYNPLAKYDTDAPSATDPDRFDPCEDWGDFSLRYNLTSSLNYVWLFGNALSRNMGESDLSRNVFGVEYTDLQRGTCKEKLFKNVVLGIASQADFNTVQETKEEIAGYDNNNEPIVEFIPTGEEYVGWDALDEEATKYMNNIQACYESPEMGPEEIEYDDDDLAMIYVTDPIGKTPNMRVSASETTVMVPVVVGQTCDEYGENCRDIVEMQAKAACNIGDKQIVDSAGHPCWAFCKERYIPNQTCYTGALKETRDANIENPLSATATSLENSLNNRRRAIMKDKDSDEIYVPYSTPTSPGDEAQPLTEPHVIRERGFLYMSIKNGDNIYNVRVQHNLHKDFIFGSSTKRDSGFRPPPHTFTFPLPFCPNSNTEYEYAVCNVPKSRHALFGGSSIPHCLTEDSSFPNTYKEEVRKWVVSNLRVADTRIPDPEGWDSMNSIGGKKRWQWAFQLLEKTTFKFVKNTSETSYWDIGNNYQNITGTEGMCNLDRGSRGFRYFKNNNIKFKYYTYNGYSEEIDEIYIYMDTNYKSKHMWHAGWKEPDASSPGVAEVAEEYKVTPVGKDYPCFYSNGTTSGTFKATQYVDTSYSPLVININTKQGVHLVGLDAGVRFMGRRSIRKRDKRKEEYDNTYTMILRDEEDMFKGVQRTGVIVKSYVNTGWIDGAQGDALLVYDLNDNGKIDSGFELFGEATVVEKEMKYENEWGDHDVGTFAKNGFVALHQYDQNDDLIIDEKDDQIWPKLKLWQDGKAGIPDGVVDEVELLSLSDVGVVSFNLDKVVVMNERDKYGNQTKLRSIIKYKDDNGEIQDGIIFDVYFTYDPLSPQERNAIRSMTDEEKNNMIDLRNL